MIIKKEIGSALRASYQILTGRPNSPTGGPVGHKRFVFAPKETGHNENGNPE